MANASLDLTLSLPWLRLDPETARLSGAVRKRLFGKNIGVTLFSTAFDGIQGQGRFNLSVTVDSPIVDELDQTQSNSTSGTAYWAARSSARFAGKPGENEKP